MGCKLDEDEKEEGRCRLDDRRNTACGADSGEEYL